MGRKPKLMDGEFGVIASRPLPPASLIGEGDIYRNFLPAPEIGAWVEKVLLSEDSPLFNPDHHHLVDADIAYLWAAQENKRQMRRVVGQCEEVAFRCGAWQKGRQEQQMREWFGRVPGYLITLDAMYVSACSDIEWCALIEHELFHIAHKSDEFGAPAFTKDGLPKLGMRGHDVEEFIGVVKRYGIGSPDGMTAQFITAAQQAPEVGALKIAQACGTCLLRAA